jgi:hypothetical protein
MKNSKNKTKKVTAATKKKVKALKKKKNPGYTRIDMGTMEPIEGFSKVYTFSNIP